MNFITKLTTDALASPAKASIEKIRTVLFQTAVVMAVTNIAGTMFLSLPLFLRSVMFPV